MFDLIRKNKLSKIVSCYLAIQLVTTIIAPTAAYALTSGPSQPEFNSFTPIGTSDMVNLSTGDFNYNIPIMDVGGYPLNLSYNSGVTMDQEASWVGLGWNLNIGQIARNVRGIPDDFNGDLMRYENQSRENRTIGAGAYATGAFFGVDALTANIGLGVSHNTFSGYTPTPSIGVSYKINDNISLGVDFSSNIESGPTVSPRVNLSHQRKDSENNVISSMQSGFGLGYNARQGLQNFNLSFSSNRLSKHFDLGLSAGVSFNDQHYTPRNRAGLRTDSFNFTGSFGTTIIGVQAQVQLTGYGSYQKIKEGEEDKLVPSFGYQSTEYSHSLENGGILDVNRLNDGIVNKNTNVLSVPNYTYDNYAIQGQGIGGSFRPYRGQVSYLYDKMVSDESGSDTFGTEVGSGNTVYGGFEVKLTNASAISQKWENKNFTLPRFTEHPEDDNLIDYESYYFKTYGEFNIDPESGLLNNDLLAESPIRLKIFGSKYDRSLKSIYETGTSSEETSSIQAKIKRDKRHHRNTAIATITNREAQYDEHIMYRDEAFAKAHHTAGMKVLKPDGSTYVYGETAYNTNKIEASFDVSKYRAIADCDTGLISYNPNLIANRSSRSDGFLNRITTPAYAHSYLLSSVLSSDYEDLTGNGPTNDDLGSYTKFIYKKPSTNNYKWRVPFELNKASYNEGLKSHKEDEKANYIYGEKELKYVHKIETKTHVALFKLSSREDARGVLGENGGLETAGDGSMQRLEKIYLFSKPEYTAELSTRLENDDPADDPLEAELMKSTIKIAHFKYTYDLCPGIKNSITNGGKLTLDKLYFTYRSSYMGMHTPYTFNYADFDGDGNMEANYQYDLKGYDIWGGYKLNEDATCASDSPLTTTEYPYVNQNKQMADNYTRAWSLSSINLPSGGQIEVQLESDDYKYVQERDAMQMFKVVGAGSDAGFQGEVPSTFNDNNSQLYESKPLYDDDHYPYLYIKLAEGEELSLTSEEFTSTYLKGQINKPIFFRFLLNMFHTDADLYDYVEGYFLIDENKLSDINIFTDNNNTYASLPMEFLELEGVSNNGQEVNPISKAGWFFGRQYLTRLVYGDEGDLNTDSFEDIVEGIIDALGQMSELSDSPNGVLAQNGIAKKFIENKSWIRLVNPNGSKLGGGARVATIKLFDQWDAMATNGFLQFYGQEYNYSLEGDQVSDDADGIYTSSGVATFEPNSSKENPYIEPFYGDSDDSYKDKITAPKESNYVETPIAASFYPSPAVTYSKVTVANLERIQEAGDSLVLTKHATGKVVTEHYTSKDFPTQASFTPIDARRDNASAISQLFNFSVKNHATMSQGFVVETNDMNGKLKRQQVYAQNKPGPISGTEYIYNTNTDNVRRLDNLLPTINEEGNIKEQLIGANYEVINDFRENITKTRTGGLNNNVTLFSIPPIIPSSPPIYVPWPTLAKHETLLRTASTMKHIHKNGVLVEKKAFDLGSNVSTKNIAWDSKTGEVLLTQTINEYDDNYFNFTYPVHWYDYYEGMGQASQNLGLSGRLARANTGYFDLSSETNEQSLNAGEYLLEGDELLIESYDDQAITPEVVWVAGFNAENDVLLMKRNGTILDECAEEEPRNYLFKVIRSGYRNQQTASMASVTSMRNPIDTDGDATFSNLTSNSLLYTSSSNNPLHKVVNASAVRYKEFWPEHREGAIKPLYLNNGVLDNTLQHANPYLQNMKSEWRAVASYAYLTGRNFNTNTTATGASPRNEGFFTDFSPFYRLSNTPNQTWEIVSDNWTFASRVSKYSPYGAELENVDALTRYSGAQYGYNNTLPMAVGSNSKYQELGFDGFEEGGASPIQNPNISDHFNFSNGNTTNTSETDVTSHTGSYSMAVMGYNNEVTAEYSLLESVLEPREAVCPIDMPVEPDGPPFCQQQSFFFNPCQNAQTLILELDYNFGPSGPDVNGPNGAVDFVYLDGGNFENYNVNYLSELNGGNGGFVMNFNPRACLETTSGSISFELTLYSANGETCNLQVVDSIIAVNENCPVPCEDDNCCN